MKRPVRNLDIDILEIVLARAAHDRCCPWPARSRRVTVGVLAVRLTATAARRRVLGGIGVVQRAAGVRALGCLRISACGCGGGDQLAAVLAALGSQVDDPVGCANHIQVVLDDEQRMAGLEQQAKGVHQARDVLEVQSGGRLIEDQQFADAARRRAVLAAAVPRARRAPGRLGQMTGEFQPLRFAARQGRHRLAQAHIVEAHVHQRLQPCADRRRDRRRMPAPRWPSAPAPRRCWRAGRWHPRCAPAASRRDSGVPLHSPQRRYTSDRNCISTCSKPLPPQAGQRPVPELKLKVPAV